MGCSAACRGSLLLMISEPSETCRRSNIVHDRMRSTMRRARVGGAAGRDRNVALPSDDWQPPLQSTESCDIFPAQVNAQSREWEALQEATATLDVLAAFAAFAAEAEGPTCRASFVPHGAHWRN